MKSQLTNYNYFKPSKLFLNDDNLINYKDLSSTKNIEQNNIQNYSYYLNGNLPKNNHENDKNIDNFLTKDIINSINEKDSEPNNKSSKTESIKEISNQDETESYEEEENDNINDEQIKIEKEISKGFPFNLGINNIYDFPIKNNFNNNEQISHDNNNLNNNNENNNCWNFNVDPNKIFNKDSKNNQHNNEKNKLIGNNINIKSEANIKIDDIEIINEGYLKNRELTFDNYFLNQKFNLFRAQNNYNNFKNKTNNKQSQNNYIENNCINKNSKIKNNFLEKNDLHNKLNINCLNLNDQLNEMNTNQTSFFNNNNFNLYMNNKIIYYNNYINLGEPNNNSHNTKNNINNNNNYSITMFGKIGWICRLCNNFNFESRCICNRCKAIKTPKTKEEIIKERKNGKILNKRIKNKKKDWLCLNCQNINFSFRKKCNRCHIQRKKEYPLVFLERNKN